MRRNLARLVVGAWVSIFLSTGSWAVEGGAQLANNIIGGGASGALVGLTAGSWAYGADKNYHAEYLLSGTLYGFLGGVILGSGAGVYELATRRPDNGFTVCDDLAAGTALGAMIGLVVGALPYLQDKKGENFTVGLGVGGVIGASVGLTLAVIDISARSPEGEKLLSGKMGLLAFSPYLPALLPDQQPEAVWNCRLVQVQF